MERFVEGGTEREILLGLSGTLSSSLFGCMLNR
jgi:hypothetical protein